MPGGGKARIIKSGKINYLGNRNMKKYEVLQKMHSERVFAILRLASAQTAEKCIAALAEGGIHCMEITMTVPLAHRAIESACAGKEGKVLVGAGTVLDAESARIAVLSGAQFVVSPNFNEEVVRTCNRYGVPAICGVATPTEAARALEAGADVLKLFPANIYPYSIIKTLRGPFPNIELILTGGIGLGNIGEWLKAGAFACGVGGELLRGADEGDYARVTASAKKFKEAAL